MSAAVPSGNVVGANGPGILHDVAAQAVISAATASAVVQAVQRAPGALTCSHPGCTGPGVRDCRAGYGDDPLVHCGKSYCGNHVLYFEYHTMTTRNSCYVCVACKERTDVLAAAARQAKADAEAAQAIAQAATERARAAAAAAAARDAAYTRAKTSWRNKFFKVYWATLSSKIATIAIHGVLLISIIIMAASQPTCSAVGAGCTDSPNSCQCTCPWTYCSAPAYPESMNVGATMFVLSFVAAVAQSCIAYHMCYCFGCINYDPDQAAYEPLRA